MIYSSLSTLIEALERGTKMHICIAFLGNCGNQKTRCHHNQAIHNQPVCLAVKQTPEGLSSCYRCRNTVQKAVIRHRKSIAGICANGVYEYCRPVIYENQVRCVIFIGNILTQSPIQRQRLEAQGVTELLHTMEQSFSPEDCKTVADILESYIHFLLRHYGMENNGYDPLVDNIKNYIRENLAYGLTIPQLAEAFNYTEKYLGRMFKARTGQTIKEYCNHAKINTAKKLLTETSLNMESVATQSGFNSVTYFDRIFRKITGLTPQMYRTSVQTRTPVSRSASSQI